ncbi:MAG TPA: N-acetylmuramoyl-L-alanine amidase-like domain-containing protein, partial [Gammaproteobacteria bacterium]|nr:N-acetylmuramoyl-L-alanine amidase-like domain-containing protein [Gammaproteobacteria bacterium]
MNEQLPELHALCLKIANQDFKTRLQSLCEYFLGINYGAWRNGSSIEALDDFNYDLNTLDCVTYAEVVLALAKSDPHADYMTFVRRFENMLCHIHYNKGIPSFLASNHIFCIDWIENNKYMVEDMTQNLSATVKIAETQIDKLAYFMRHKINAANSAELPESVQSQLAKRISTVPYIETEDLLNNFAQYMAKFPEYCIVNIVRPNWDLTERIGTHLNISHLGFCIKDNVADDLKFYHATSEKLKVVQETLDVYMLRQQSSPTIRGINVLT